LCPNQTTCKICAHVLRLAADCRNIAADVAEPYLRRTSSVGPAYGRNWRIIPDETLEYTQFLRKLNVFELALCIDGGPSRVQTAQLLRTKRSPEDGGLTHQPDVSNCGTLNGERRRA